MGARHRRGTFAIREFPDDSWPIFARALPAFTEFTSPRAWAFGLIGIHEYLRRLSGDSLVNQTREITHVPAHGFVPAQRPARLVLV